MSRILSASLAVLLILAAAAFAVVRWADHYVHRPFPLSAPLVLNVEPGSSLKMVANQLAANGALDHPRVLVAYGRLLGKAEHIKAGEYEIRPDKTPADFLEQLVRGDVVLREVTIVEGWTFRQMLSALANNLHLAHTLQGVADSDLMTRIGSAGVHPEGQFFPDTYRFARGTTDLDILRKAHEELRRRLDAAWRTRAPDLPFADPYQALILASIVEKETRLADERTRISGVFVRRLQMGMRLQSDPTIIYGLGAGFDGDLRTKDLHADTPYNTYTRSGLPPTPIALPGEGALQAATHPLESGALFFVATGEPDGSHYFSATLAEHSAAVRRYLARLRARPAAQESPPVAQDAR